MSSESALTWEDVPPRSFADWFVVDFARRISPALGLRRRLRDENQRRAREGEALLPSPLLLPIEVRSEPLDVEALEERFGAGDFLGACELLVGAYVPVAERIGGDEVSADLVLSWCVLATGGDVTA